MRASGSQRQRKMSNQRDTALRHKKPLILKTNRQKPLGRAVAVATVVSALAVPTLAQQSETQQQEPVYTKEQTGLEEVRVVATRREVSLQEVPMSVTAIDSDTLKREQINALKDIGSLVPNLVMVTGTAGGAKSHFVASIRGQSQQERGGLADPSVMVYFGDVAVVRTQGLNQSLVDIKAIEVVRGPTGTLFGRNSTGGAIVIRPNLPNTDAVEGSVGVTLAEHGTQNFDGYVNVPLSDRVAIRFAGSSNQNDGFVHDELLGRNVNADDNSALRASILIKPTDKLENVTMVNYYDENSGGPGGSVSALNPVGLIARLGSAIRNYPPADEILSAQRARGPHKIANGVPEFTRMETLDIHNTTTLHVSDDVTIKNIFGYRDMDGHVRVSLDGMGIPVLDSEIFDDSEQWSNEFQVFGQTNKLQWIAGAYYFNEEGGNNAFSRAFATEADLIEPLSLVNVTGAINNHQEFDNTSYAVFAEFTYDLGDMLPGLSLTVGGRQTWDEREAIILNRNVNTSCRFTIDDDNDPSTPEINPGAGPDCRLDVDEKFDDFTYNIALQYKPDASTLLYGSVRRGFRAGGFPARANQGSGSAYSVRTRIRDHLGSWCEAGLGVGRGCFPAHQPDSLLFGLSGRAAPTRRHNVG